MKTGARVKKEKVRPIPAYTGEEKTWEGGVEGGVVTVKKKFSKTFER